MVPFGAAVAFGIAAIVLLAVSKVAGAVVVLGGVTAWGLIGLFMGPAILAALILLWREWVGSQRGPINPALQDV